MKKKNRCSNNHGTQEWAVKNSGAEEEWAGYIDCTNLNVFSSAGSIDKLISL
jgi:hypothetical protein